MEAIKLISERKPFPRKGGERTAKEPGGMEAAAGLLESEDCVDLVDYVFWQECRALDIEPFHARRDFYAAES
jgi:hypothetical protein